MEELQEAHEVPQNPISDIIEEGGVPVEEYQEETVQQEYEQADIDSDEVYEDIPTQDVGPETSQVNWETEAKKFQSMYDKTSSDNAKMQQFIMKQAEMQSPQAGQSDGAQQVDIPSEDEFSPWDAYYKPGSPSFNMRTIQEDERIGTAVQEHMTQLNNQMVMNNTVRELKDGYKMEEKEVRDFMSFATTPRGDLPLDTLVKVWAEGKKPQSPNSLQKVKSNRNAPRTAGVVQGQAHQPPKDDATKTWDKIMGAGSRFDSKIP